MPNYRYRCECGNDWHEVRSVADRGLAICPFCGLGCAQVFEAPTAIAGTDSLYYAHKRYLADQMGDGDLRHRIANAERSGFIPSASAVYEPGLADYPGDPKAFITGGQNQINHRLEEMRAKKTSKPVPLAENLVRRYAREMVQKDPNLKKLRKQELRERVIAKHRATIV